MISSMDQELYEELARDCGEPSARVQEELLSETLRRARRTRFWGDRVGTSLSEVPILGRDTLRRCINEMIDPRFTESQLKWVSTGGTTGTPVRIPRSRAEYGWERAFVYHVLRRIDVTPGDRGAVLTGRELSGTERLARFRKRENLLWISCARWVRSTWEAAWQHLKDFEPSFVRGYPSVLAEFAHFLAGAGLRPPSTIRGVAFSSENMLPAQRRIITGTFRCPVVGLYGQAERVAMAATCERSDRYHIIPEYGIVELVDADGNVITEPGREGEIVGTSLQPRAAILLRYRTGDRATWDESTCPCGRDQRLLRRLSGRTREFLIGPDGDRILFGPAIYDRLLNDLPIAARVQFRQTSPGRLTVGVSGAQVGDTFVIDRLPDLLDRFEIVVEDAETLHRTASGKLPLLVQRIPGSEDLP